MILRVFGKREKERNCLRRLKVEYLCGDALWFYALIKVKSSLVTDFLEAKQKEEGYQGEIYHQKAGTFSLPIEGASLAIEALSRVFGPNDESVIRAVKGLTSNRKEDGSWGSVDDTAYACLALMSVGEGPKIPLEEVEWLLTKQELKITKPTFIYSP